MTAASGTETAYTLAYTTNKAGGNDNGLIIAMTDTASPATSLPLQVNVGGATKCSVDNAGSGIFVGTLSASNLSGTNTGDQTLASLGAPGRATYITQTADATLTAEQALGALTTGILKSTTTTGVLSIAIATDFPTLNQNTTGSAGAATLTTARDL